MLYTIGDYSARSISALYLEGGISLKLSRESNELYHMLFDLIVGKIERDILAGNIPLEGDHPAPVEIMLRLPMNKDEEAVINIHFVADHQW